MWHGKDRYVLTKHFLLAVFYNQIVHIYISSIKKSGSMPCMSYSSMNFCQGPLYLLKCQKGPYCGRNVKTTMAAGSPGDTCRLPPRTEAARRVTESSREPKRKTGSVGPAASDAGGMMTWRLPHWRRRQACRPAGILQRVTAVQRLHACMQRLDSPAQLSCLASACNAWIQTT